MPRWLMLLCAYLIGWVPVNFAVLAVTSLPSIDERGSAAVIELALHAAAALLCAAGGSMLRVGNPAGRPLTVTALIAHAAVTIQALHVSALPRDVPPGLALPLTILWCAHALGWVTYLHRSRRLRAWLHDA